MLYLHRLCFLTLLMTLVLSCSQEQLVYDQCNKDLISSSFLFTASQAQQYLSNNDNAILIQISKPEVYANEHIPNAINLWRPDFRTKVVSDFSGLRCTRVELDSLLSEIGVDSTKLLIYTITKVLWMPLDLLGC